jgi:hypothetical protein
MAGWGKGSFGSAGLAPIERTAFQPINATMQAIAIARPITGLRMISPPQLVHRVYVRPAELDVNGASGVRAGRRSVGS